MQSRKLGQLFLGESEPKTDFADGLAKHFLRVIGHVPNVGDLTAISLATISMMTMSIEQLVRLGQLGFFSEKLLHSMAGLELSPKKLAPRLGCSYEYVRKMTRSESLPSPELLTKLCSVFEWDIRSTQELVHFDECRRKYGSIFWSVLGKDPWMEPVYILFPYLTLGERQLVVDMLRAFVAAKKDKRRV